MGSLFSKPAVPGVQMPPPAAHPSTLGSASLALIGQEARQKAAAAEGEGANGTVATGPQGLTKQENTTKATLLGQ